MKEQEFEANYFASCLLMPKKEVEKQRQKTKSISELAKFFKVSEESMGYRIADL
jgi:Zn-dependent peptidase ImmA (M78 family)